MTPFKVLGGLFLCLKQKGFEAAAPRNRVRGVNNGAINAHGWCGHDASLVNLHQGFHLFNLGVEIVFSQYLEDHCVHFFTFITAVAVNLYVQNTSLPDDALSCFLHCTPAELVGQDRG